MTLAKRAVKMATKAEAEARRKVLRSVYHGMETAWMKRGRGTQEGIDAHDPEALGLTAEAWGESIFGAGWPRIKRARQAFNGLRHLPEKEIAELSEGNAVTLSRLPPKLRAASLDKAKRLSVRAFKEDMAVQLEARGVPRTKTKHFDGVNMAEDSYELVME